MYNEWDFAALSQEVCASVLGWYLDLQFLFGRITWIIWEQSYYSYSSISSTWKWVNVPLLKHTLIIRGYIIYVDGVATNSTKINAMLNMPTPTTVTELRGFLGLTGYYRRFVNHYGILAKPLTNLLKKKSFQWDSAADTTFQQLKSVLWLRHLFWLYPILPFLL